MYNSVHESGPALRSFQLEVQADVKPLLDAFAGIDYLLDNLSERAR